MAISNRYSSVARPDIIVTECRFLIHSMPKDIRKLQLKFDHDPTVGSKVMAISNRYSNLARADLIITEYQFLIHSMENCFRKSCKSFIAIKRLDQKLWPLQTVTLAWRDHTSSSPSIDSSSTP